MKVVTVEQMRAIEAAADAAGHTYAAMMEQAGKAVAEALIDRVEVEGKRVLVLVGPGNNGGDGLVAARYLAQAGAEVVCYLTRPRDPRKDENLQRLHEMSTSCALATEDQSGRSLRRLTAGADVIIDALLGTGTKLPVTGIVAQVLRQAGKALQRKATPPGLVRLGGVPEPPQRTRPFLAAVDGPSGLDFDTGALDEAALPADLSVTFAYPKQGHFRFPGAAALGSLVVADIGTDPKLAADVDLEVLTPEMVQAWLPARPADAHKGTFGRALIIAGSANYTGAARLAGASAVRAGAGLVTVALPASIHPAVAAGLAEATYLLLPHELGAVKKAAAAVLAEQMPQYDAMLLGPGLGQERETVSLVKELLSGGAERRSVGFLHTNDTTSQPQSLPNLVVDADGLNILAQLEDWSSRLPPETILTPHPGEMARLMDCSTAEIQDRISIAREQAQAWGHVVVLKGAYTAVTGPNRQAVLVPFANPGLATGGTGDVLAGIIVALRAQGLEPFEAAAAGAYLHGLAGELARLKLGTAGMTATDLIDGLPSAWQCLQAE